MSKEKRIIDADKAWEYAQKVFSDPILLYSIKRIIDNVPLADKPFNYQDSNSDCRLYDCDYCRNATTCEELYHNNDLSYMSCGEVDSPNLRMMFRTGDNRKTELILELLTTKGLNHTDLEWSVIAKLAPHYCPFCGRPLVENM